MYCRCYVSMQSQIICRNGHTDKKLDMIVPGTVETATSRAPRPPGPRIMRRSDFPEPESCCNNPPSRILPPKLFPDRYVSRLKSDPSQYYSVKFEKELPIGCYYIVSNQNHAIETHNLLTEYNISNIYKRQDKKSPSNAFRTIS